MFTSYSFVMNTSLSSLLIHMMTWLTIMPSFADEGCGDMREGMRKTSALPMRWLIAMSLAVIGVAICMWIWVQPQGSLQAGTWTDLNDEIESMMAAEGKEAQISESKMSSKSTPVTEQHAQNKQQPSASTVAQKDDGADTGKGGQSEAASLLPSTDVLKTEKEHSSAAGNKGAKGAVSQLLNINEADASALVTLPGIGPSKAKAIIEYREKKGAFRHVDDLMKVKGIGKKMLGKIRDQVRVE